ncbi:MAG: glutamine-hydrolyzing carbamoyl-phosphate synthase small subunit [Thermoleophilia bacterium]|nr:glutamine-hydrolyzing carbamoyl-phosphate synthase small subunit [Thermoleophilia bacterium]
MNQMNQKTSEMPAAVILEDGTIFRGRGFGTPGAVFGEVVFNTGMTGYQEVLTDPSYHGQMVTFTYPLIGNYGIDFAVNESDTVHSRAVIVREAHNLARNCRAEKGWVDWLIEQQVTGVAGIDTRALTRRIRSVGAMRAGVYWGDFTEEDIAVRLDSTPSMAGLDLASRVTCSEPYEIEFLKGIHRVVVIDYGIKRSILKQLGAAGCNVTVLPAWATAEDVMAHEPEGVFLSNGPGDPAPLDYAVRCVERLLGKVPVFGICLGHQILSMALGLKTYKLKFGHRGVNHPVKNLHTDKVEITSQNHGFAVELPEALAERLGAPGSTGDSGTGKGGSGAVLADGAAPGPAKTFFEAPPAADLKLDTAFGEARISHLNLYDGTVEGIRCQDVQAFSVQYHPEASPGPHDSRYLFEDFVNDIVINKLKKS